METRTRNAAADTIEVNSGFSFRLLNFDGGLARGKRSGLCSLLKMRAQDQDRGKRGGVMEPEDAFIEYQDKKTRQWDEIVENVVVVAHQDRVREHTYDDFDLGPGWVFAGGTYIKDALGQRRWWMVFVLPRAEYREAVGPWLSEGLGSFEFIQWADDSWHAIARSEINIGSRMTTLEGEPPAKLQQFFKRSVNHGTA